MIASKDEGQVPGGSVTREDSRIIVAGEFCIPGEGQKDIIMPFRSLVDAYIEEPAELCDIDVTGVTFVDSVGLRELIRASRVAEQKGLATRLHISPVVGRLLDVTGTMGLFEIVMQPPDVPKSV